MSTFSAVVTVMNSYSGPTVVIGNGGNSVVPKSHRYSLVGEPAENETVTRDLQLVDGGYHVDSIVDNVGHSRVYLTVQ